MPAAVGPISKCAPSACIGTLGVIDRIPQGARVYITIDIDAFCPSIAPGTGTPSHGGFLYYDILK